MLTTPPPPNQTAVRPRHVAPNGYFVLPVKGVGHTVIGGPFDAFSGGFGVCLEKESRKARLATLAVDVPDFGVPARYVFENLIENIVLHMLENPRGTVFIGCKGGIGRTGMVMAGLVRALGIDSHEPVAWVRANYLRHAVETEAQVRLVETFNVSRIQRLLAQPAPAPTFFERLRVYFTRVSK